MPCVGSGRSLGAAGRVPRGSGATVILKGPEKSTQCNVRREIETANSCITFVIQI